MDSETVINTEAKETESPSSTGSDMEKGSNETPETDPEMTSSGPQVTEEENSIAEEIHEMAFGEEKSICKADAMRPSISFSLPPVKEQSNAVRSGVLTGTRRVSQQSSAQTSYKTKSGMTRESKRISSIEMRRLPVSILLAPLDDNASVLSDDFEEQKKSKDEAVGHSMGWLQRLCLRPGYSLRTQLMLSFGSISAITVTVVVVICILVAVGAGANVKDTTNMAYRGLALDTASITARYLSESLSEKIGMEPAIKLLYEATQDRFAGYPNAVDDYVPFTDIVSGTNKYPLDLSEEVMPLEWQFESNVNQTNYEEHFRGQNYYRNRSASTASASFFMKGICDPLAMAGDDAYWENCTDANNDIARGGIVTPTNTTKTIYKKAKDLVPLLKAIHESYEVIRDLGLFFVNDGAGASVNYPHYPLSTNSNYISRGCDFLNEPNFYDRNRTIGTPEMIERCSPNGTKVSTRLYSPIERPWCIDQARNPDRIRYQLGQDAWDPDGSLLMTTGQAIFDRVTNEFIACIYIGVPLDFVEEELDKSVFVKGQQLTLIKLDESGSVVGTTSSRENQNGESIDGLNVGLTKEEYKNLYDLVDFSSEWNPQEIRKKYDSYSVKDQDYFVTAYPMPPIPGAYDETYEPLFMVIVSSPLTSLFSESEKSLQIVDARVEDVTKFSVIVGAVGLGISFLIIFIMANMLTRPLLRMNKIASEIVSNFGDPTKDHEIEKNDVEASKEARCTPRTEISGVVREFDKMVASFSGSSMVKTHHHKHHEVYNMFTLHSDFSELYASRQDKTFKYTIIEPREDIEPTREDDDEQSLFYRNPGTNILNDNDTFTTSGDKKSGSHHLTRNRFSSPLFLWIVALIVTPLLLVNVVITAVSLNFVANKFTESSEESQEFLLDIQIKNLAVNSRLRAALVSRQTGRAAEDTHILTRYASWILFGGVGVANTYTQLITGVEECKSYNDIRNECPYVFENTVCDCAWNDPEAAVCEAFSSDSRTLQAAHWVCQSQAVDENGNRSSNLYPELSYSPETTGWWASQTEIPGFEAGSFSVGYKNTYERLRMASAMPLFEALWNYHEIKNSTLASYLAFEADGMFVGYSGCENGIHPGLAEFKSTVQNGAFRLRPELCPLGKFGYDPRCRGWYDTGRKLARNNETFIHITAPYRFANLKLGIAQSATAPLIDPITEEHVGQTLFDFVPAAMIRSLKDETPLSPGGAAILIAVDGAYSEDTVVAPGHKQTDEPTAIGSKVLPFDEGCESQICKDNMEQFNKIVVEMKAGISSTSTFSRSTATGAQEIVYIAYNPVTVQGFRQLDSSQFSRGLEQKEQLVYSLGLIETESGILEDFDPIEEETNRQIGIAIGVLCSMIVLATMCVVYVSLRVSRSIAEPMIYLLDIIRSIRKNENNEAPDLREVKASKEIVAFADSIDMLSKVVRSANSAFYAGEFEIAYHVLVDALRLFRRLDNKKAIGIACNNLGNIMLGIYQEMVQEDLDTFAGLTIRQVVTRGIAYFHEAIQLGEKAYDEFYDMNGWTPICLDFMQHLSNRYFNRGLFLLSVKDTHEESEEIVQLGMRDIQIASDMDSEVVAYGEDIGWSSRDRIKKMFEVMLVRARGYNLILSLGYEDEWEVEEILNDTFDIVKSEQRSGGTGELFSNISFAGRMQEIETELMKYFETIGDLNKAAQIAIRCLKEDEKIFVDTQAQAIDVLMQYTGHRKDLRPSSISRITTTLQDYTNSIEDEVNHKLQTSFNDMESEIFSKADSSAFTKSNGSGRTLRFSSSCWSMRQSSGRFVTMEDF